MNLLLLLLRFVDFKMRRWLARDPKNKYVGVVEEKVDDLEY